MPVPNTSRSGTCVCACVYINIEISRKDYNINIVKRKDFISKESKSYEESRPKLPFA